ncbi:MAG: tetratricopeptide repeat protein [Thermoanaerobaculaceae bacterium]|nr:tetratricopeptide repeat protein [Thermoanaerobaculaceae bacterium]MDI9621656.1 tetratricopeptide repeat protein [Acidobacteriota bacterium]NLH10762.1 tetratricopeptide repeat protein [Holophagae bacterium]HPW55971.1 tetratricopeptide repeat protein [Thermoanaerobaculaceae bacterium]
MWKNPVMTLVAGLLLGFFGGYLAGQRQPRPAAPPASGPAMPADPHAGVPGAPPLGPGAALAAPDAHLTQELHELEAMLATNPESYELLVRAGNVLYDLGSFTRAIDYYERARRLRDDSPDVLTDSGVAYRETGNPARAAELFEQAARLSPGHWQSRFNLIIVKLFDLNDPAGAERVLAELKALPEKPAGFPDLAPIEKEIAARKAK